MPSKTRRVLIRNKADGSEYSVTEDAFYTYQPHTEETDPAQAGKTFEQLGYRIISWEDGQPHKRDAADRAPAAETKSEPKD